MKIFVFGAILLCFLSCEEKASFPSETLRNRDQAFEKVYFVSS